MNRSNLLPSEHLFSPAEGERAPSSTRGWRPSLPLPFVTVKITFLQWDLPRPSSSKSAPGRGGSGPMGHVAIKDLRALLHRTQSKPPLFVQSCRKLKPCWPLKYETMTCESSTHGAKCSLCFRHSSVPEASSTSGGTALTSQTRSLPQAPLHLWKTRHGPEGHKRQDKGRSHP